jgi:hypothetical protein
MPKFQILYARQPTFHPSGMYGTPYLTLHSLEFSHVFVCEVEALTLNGAVWNMQGEVWSPNGEARPLIQSLGLGHTSMSIGDVAQDPQGVLGIPRLGWMESHRGRRPCPNPNMKPATSASSGSSRKDNAA